MPRLRLLTTLGAIVTPLAACADSFGANGIGFSVGGTATGVIGSGCVLQLNGTNDLALTGNGPFTFGTRLLPNAAYVATVLLPPRGPTQTCTVANPTGTVPSANVTTLAVSCTVTRPVCGAAEDLGSITGDVGGPTVSRNDAGERWFRLRLTEGNDQAVYLSARVTLTVPPGVDYDLHVYCAACGGLLAGSSTNVAGQIDQVTVRWEDDVGEDDIGDIFILVSYVSGSSPSNWTLEVLGNTPVSTTTCDF